MAADEIQPTPEPILNFPSNNITVRPYSLESDVRSISANANNLAVWNNLRNRIPYPYTEDHARTWMAHASSTTVATGPYDPATNRGTGPEMTTHFTIVVDGQAVGSIGLEFGDAAEIYCRTAELGYWLGEPYWGKGIMGLVVPAFVEWCWSNWATLVRLNAEVDAGNVGSRRCLERAGLVMEGRREKAILKSGVLKDVVFMGVVRPGLEET